MKINEIALKCKNCKIKFNKYYPEYKRQKQQGRISFFCSLKCSSSYTSKRLAIAIKDNYFRNPKVCLNCKKALNFIQSKRNKFCSRKCSAQFNFKDGKSKTQWSEERKEQLSKKLKLFYKLNPKPSLKGKTRNKTKIRMCKHCKSVLIKSKKFICDVCKFQYYEIYRNSCKFDFNLFDYPNKFDLNLVKELGIYSPTNKNNNLNGVSKDHMYSIYDGFLNKIDALLLKHPANCQLLPHKQNQNKNRKSSISLSELKIRIKNW